MFCFRPTFLLLIICGLYAAPVLAQDQTDVIRGRVRTTTGVPIVGAHVSAVEDSTGASREATTDADGRYMLVFPHGRGAYVLEAHALGMRLAEARVLRAADEAVLIRDVTMVPASANELRPVRVERKRTRRTPRPIRNSTRPGAGAAEQLLDQDTDRIPPSARGDLGALAGTMPGMRLTPNGYSALGAGPGQNATTLNGAAFDGSRIPLGASVNARSSLSTYDPARGGFSGSQTAVTLPPGANFVTRTLTFAFDSPLLQATDAVSRQLGQTRANAQASWAGTGPLIEDKVFYNTSVEIGRGSSALAALGTYPAAAAQRVGVAPDSIARLTQLLATAAIPAMPPGTPRAATTSSMVWLSQLDVSPKGTNRSLTVTTYADLERQDGTGLTPDAVVAHGGTAADQHGNVQAVYRSPFGNGFLNQLQASFTLSGQQTRPYLRLPDGHVFVASQLPDGRAGAATLAFGGNAGTEGDTRRHLWELRNETSWFTDDSKHRLTLMADVQQANVWQGVPADASGSYSYTSLADLANNVPSAFTRTLGMRPAAVGGWTAAASFGDAWRPASTLQLQYGLRLDGMRLTSAPAYNAAVDSLFGVRTNRVPGGWTLSPRLGFTWLYGGLPGSSTDDGIVRVTVSDGSNRGVIRGGVGAFQGTIAPANLLSLWTSTGTAGGPRQLSCVGLAVPTPDWARFASDPSSVPTACLDTGNSGSFAAVAPAVQLAGSDYRAPRSWRANLAWSTTRKGYELNAEAIYSLGLAQPSAVDLNFTGVPRFTLADEGGRPVYVPSTSIVPASGVVAAAGARVTPTFGEVLRLRSDLHAVAKQLTLSVAPVSGWRLTPRLQYTLSSERDQRRGFGGMGWTVGDPRAVGWGRSDGDVRHQLLLSLSGQVGGVMVSAYDMVLSGIPYTPIVGGDVNGDGYTNDVAFVPALGHTADTALTREMRALLAGAPDGVRRCLGRQLGRFAGRNSCDGPWVHQMSLTLQASGPTLHLPDRVSAQLYVSNPLGGLDQLLHGTGHLRGWGTFTYPDPVLLVARGFDADAGQFRYQVNPHFGDTRPASNALRAPFQVTLSFSVGIGPSWETQAVRGVLRPGRSKPGARVTAATIKAQFAALSQFVFVVPMRMKDTLLLTPEQRTQVQSLIDEFTARVDLLWTPVAEHLAGLGERYDEKVETKQVRATNAAVAKLSPAFGARLRVLLTPGQWLLLPEWYRSLLSAREGAEIRSG